MKFFAVLFATLFATAVSAQTGEAFVQQLGASSPNSAMQAGSFASLEQTGTRNEARIEQTGGSVARVDQSGTGNLLAGINALSGLGDGLTPTFQSDMSLLVLSQTGTDNQAFVHQDSGAYAEITQNGTGNAVQLLQSGSFY